MSTNNLVIYDPNVRVLSYPYYCVGNEWYRALSNFVEQRKRLPVLDNPAPESGYTPLSSHSPMSRWETLYSNMARVSAEYLRNCGVTLPATTISNKQFELCALYLIETSVVVFQSVGKDGGDGNEAKGGKKGLKTVLCTKNMNLLSSEFTLSKSRLKEFKKYCAENTEEVISGKFKCAEFSLTETGFTKPYCRTVSVNAPNSMLIPVMSVWQYVNLLLNKMRGDKVVRLVYQDRFNQRQEIVTSLNPRIVYNRFGNSIDPSTIGVLNPEMPAVLLTLVDLQKRTVVDVPITQIISAKPEA